MEEKKKALKADGKDNVATVFSNGVAVGTAITTYDKNGTSVEIIAASDVPFGHKIAVRYIKSGEPIVKYGEIIGDANTDIKTGEYVHIHNMEARRGRGDLEGKR